MTHTSEAIEARGAETLPEFIELLEEAGGWLFARGIAQWPPGSNRAQEPSFRVQLERGALLVVDADDGLAGGCLVTTDRYEAFAERRGEAAYLHKLAVARAAAGGGLGARIVAGAEAWARGQGLPCVRLDCWDGSTTLRAFYRGLGYQELGAVPEHGYEVQLFEKALTL